MTNPTAATVARIAEMLTAVEQALDDVDTYGTGWVRFDRPADGGDAVVRTVNPLLVIEDGRDDRSPLFPARMAEVARMAGRQRDSLQGGT